MWSQGAVHGRQQLGRVTRTGRTVEVEPVAHSGEPGRRILDQVAEILGIQALKPARASGRGLRNRHASILVARVGPVRVGTAKC